jgi:hypothetical protein
LRRVVQRRFQIDYRMAPYAEDTLTGLLIIALAFSGKTASIEQATNDLRRSLPS